VQATTHKPVEPHPGSLRADDPGEGGGKKRQQRLWPGESTGEDSALNDLYIAAVETQRQKQLEKVASGGLADDEIRPRDRMAVMARPPSLRFTLSLDA
jgi:hypothetical protein